MCNTVVGLFRMYQNNNIVISVLRDKSIKKIVFNIYRFKNNKHVKKKQKRHIQQKGKTQIKK